MTEIKNVGDEIQATIDVSKWRPLNNKVLIRREKNKERSDGGIIIGHSPEKNLWAQVVRVGPGRKHPETGIRIPICNVKRGDFVTCRAFEGDVFKSYLSSDGYEYAFVDDRVLELKYKGVKSDG